MCGPGTQTATSAQSIPDWALPGAKALVERGLTESQGPWANTAGMTPEQLAAMGLAPGSTSTRGLTRDQQASMQGVRDAQFSWAPYNRDATIMAQEANALSGMNASSPYMQAASNALDAVNLTSASDAVSPYLRKSMATGALSTASPYINAAGVGANTTVGNYMNPYNSAVTDRLGVLAGRNLSENLLPAVNNTFVGAGMFGSDRSADFTARAVRDANESLLGAQASALQGGYQGALSAAQTDLARQAQLAGVAGGLADSDAARALQAGTLGLNATQADINKNLSVAGANSNLGTLAQAGTNADRAGKLATSQQYSTLGQQQQQQRLQDASSLMAVGNQQQQQNLSQTNFNWDQLARLGSVMQGTPMPMTTTQTTPGPSIWSQLAGGALSLYGLSRKDGGRIPRYSGGGVLGLGGDADERRDQWEARQAREALEQAAKAATAPEIAPGPVAQSPLSTSDWLDKIDRFNPTPVQSSDTGAPLGPPKHETAASMAGPLSRGVDSIMSLIKDAGSAVAGIPGKIGDALAPSAKAQPAPADPYAVPKRPGWDNPFTTAGFAMMASKNPRFLGALGEAGLAGVGSEAGRRKEDWTALSVLPDIELKKLQAEAARKKMQNLSALQTKMFGGAPAAASSAPLSSPAAGGSPAPLAASSGPPVASASAPGPLAMNAAPSAPRTGGMNDPGTLYEMADAMTPYALTDPDIEKQRDALVKRADEMVKAGRNLVRGPDGGWTQAVQPGARQAIAETHPTTLGAEAALLDYDLRTDKGRNAFTSFKNELKGSDFERRLAALAIDPADHAAVAAAAEQGLLGGGRRGGAQALSPAQKTALWNNAQVRADHEVKMFQEASSITFTPNQVLQIRERRAAEIYAEALSRVGGGAPPASPVAAAPPLPAPPPAAVAPPAAGAPPPAAVAPPAVAPTPAPAAVPNVPPLMPLPAPAGDRKLTPSEKAGQKKTGEVLAKGIEDIRDAERAAEKSDYDNDRLASLLTDVETGKYAKAGLEVKKAVISAFGEAGRTFLARTLGLNDNVSNLEAAEALANDMALKLRNPAGGAGMPGAMSDQDREFLRSMVPGLSTTREGRALIIAYTKAVNARTRDVAKRAWDYVAEHGALDAKFHKELSAWSRENKLFVAPPPDASKWTAKEHRTLGVGWVSPDGTQFIPAPKT